MGYMTNVNHKQKVLIVDDNELRIQGYTRMLSLEEDEVIVASSLTEVRVLFEEGLIQVDGVIFSFGFDNFTNEPDLLTFVEAFVQDKELNLAAVMLVTRSPSGEGIDYLMSSEERASSLRVLPLIKVVQNWDGYDREFLDFREQVLAPSEDEEGSVPSA